MASNLSPMKARLRRCARRALTRLGREAVEYLRELCGVPVDYVSGPRGGIIVVRSKPGEPPRHEGLKNYVKKIKYRVFAGAETTEDLSVYSIDIRTLWFEGGTKHMRKRPHFTKLDRGFGGLKTKFKRYMSEELQKEKSK